MFYMGSIYGVLRKVQSGITFGAGVLVGMNLSIAGYVYATEVMATLSTQPIFVDGEQVEMTAYSINGNNYVKLRDVGEAVGFNVSWNYDESRVDIDSTSPYIADDLGEVAPATTNTTVEEMLTVTQTSSTAAKDKYTISIDNTTYSDCLANGEAITETNILAVIDEILDIFPDGTSWGDGTNGDFYVYRNGGGCNSFAWMCRDLLYGTACSPVTTHTDLSLAKAGDIVYLKNNSTGNGHWIVVAGQSVQTVTSGTYYMLDYIDGNVGGKTGDASTNIQSFEYNYPDTIIYSYY
ncbi:stalk domain-containing protein [Bengtsoniella intestinalis]|uniref:stalk domain-containing protein n=1 Tax=Bengtsoniella intestinalis TaxID=3073143 RepID=UPI00391FA0A3